mmetsp:Transcript_61361/g.129431  ORF Transcript_61361/g.129431 Transcript_61361/m.129431 type:complete len:236 (-) Transcript_61361:22-729(-)
MVVVVVVVASSLLTSSGGLASRAPPVELHLQTVSKGRVPLFSCFCSQSLRHPSVPSGQLSHQAWTQVARDGHHSKPAAPRQPCSSLMPPTSGNPHAAVVVVVVVASSFTSISVGGFASSAPPCSSHLQELSKPRSCLLSNCRLQKRRQLWVPPGQLSSQFRTQVDRDGHHSKPAAPRQPNSSFQPPSLAGATSVAMERFTPASSGGVASSAVPFSPHLQMVSFPTSKVFFHACLQ